MVFKCIEFPDKEFATKEEMFLHLKANEEKIIGLKKAQVYKSCEKSAISFINLDIEKATEAVKASFAMKQGFIYPVISTTKYIDSHRDVHFDGSMNHTARDQQGKVMYALDHELKFDSILAWPSDVKMFIANVDWALVGKNYPGQTQALVFEIEESKITKQNVLEAIKNKSNNFENSIRMQYVKISLAANSNSKDMAENKALYDARINLIANKEVAEELGYFWAIDELKIQKEGSLVVAGGSNDATRILYEEAADSTSEKSGPQIEQPKSVWDLLQPEQTSKSVWDNYLN